MAALKRPGRCRKPAATRSISLRPKDRTTIPPSLRTYLARLLRAILTPPHLGVALFRVSQSQQRIESAPIPRNLFGPDCKRQISRPSVSRFLAWQHVQFVPMADRSCLFLGAFSNADAVGVGWGCCIGFLRVGSPTYFGN